MKNKHTQILTRFSRNFFFNIVLDKRKYYLFLSLLESKRKSKGKIGEGSYVMEEVRQAWSIEYRLYSS